MDSQQKVLDLFASSAAVAPLALPSPRFIAAANVEEHEATSLKLPLEVIMRIIVLTLNFWAIEDTPRLRTRLSLVCKNWHSAVLLATPIFVIEDIRPEIFFVTIKKLSLNKRLFDFIWALPFDDFGTVVNSRVSVFDDDDCSARAFHDIEVRTNGPLNGGDTGNCAVYAFVTTELMKKKANLVRLVLKHDVLSLCRWQEVVEGNFPRLKILHVWPNYLLSLRRPSLDPPPQLNFVAPNLRKMAIRECIPPSQPFNYLTTLVIHGLRRGDWSASAFFDFLRRTPNLEILDFDGSFFTYVEPTTTPVFLPRLHSIAVYWSDHTDHLYDPLTILDVITAPNLRIIVWSTNFTSPLLYMPYPPARFTANVRLVVSGLRPPHRVHIDASVPYLSVPFWETCPAMDSVDTLVVIQSTCKPDLRGVLRTFPQLKSIHIAKDEAQASEFCVQLTGTERFDNIPVTRWSACPSAVQHMTRAVVEGL